jgi:hypothetical protein
MTARWAVSHHEAGHIVGAWSGGIRVAWATVDALGDDDGITRTEHLTRRGRAGLRGAVVMLLSGGAAEKHFAARHGFDCDPWSGSAADIQRALQLIEAFLPPDAAADFLNDLVPAARGLVAAEWDTIELLARALFEHGSLSGPELARIASR